MIPFQTVLALLSALVLLGSLSGCSQVPPPGSAARAMRNGSTTNNGKPPAKVFPTSLELKAPNGASEWDLTLIGQDAARIYKSMSITGEVQGAQTSKIGSDFSCGRDQQNGKVKFSCLIKVSAADGASIPIRPVDQVVRGQPEYVNQQYYKSDYIEQPIASTSPVVTMTVLFGNAKKIYENMLGIAPFVPVQGGRDQLYSELYNVNFYRLGGNVSCSLQALKPDPNNILVDQSLFYTCKFKLNTKTGEMVKNQSN